MAGVEPTGDRPEKPTVFPLVADAGNGRLLTEWLDATDRFDRASDPLETAAFDICILDSQMLEREQELLAKRKRETDALLPYLLLVPDVSGATLHRTLRENNPALWDLIDDVIRVPIQQYELQDRVDTLLRLREQSKRLVRKEEQLRTIRDEHAGHGVVITDTDGAIEYVNRAFENQSGYSSAEVLGENPRILRSGEHDDAFYADLWETITAGEPWHGEVINHRKDGQRYVLNQTIVPARGPDGEIERFIAVNHEITELKALEESLRKRSEQLEILNRVLRHDIRNDMMVVLGWLEYLDVDAETDPTVDRIESAARHVVDLTTTAREISEAMTTGESPEMKPMSLTRVLLEVGRKCRETYDHAQIELPESAPPVTVEANELLASVFRNLLNNAIQHNDSDTPRVTVTLEETDGGVLVRVADNGPGVPESRKAEIFGDEVKGLDSTGTGMGLYLVSTLVGMYGGEVWVEDNEPRGAVFCVELDTVEATTTTGTQQ